MKSLPLPHDVLNITLGEVYEGPYTLQDELEKVGEELIWVDYELCGPSGDERGYFKSFLGYSKNYVFTLVHSIFGDECLVVLPRNPEQEMKK